MSQHKETVAKQVSTETEKIFRNLIERLNCLEAAIVRHKVENEQTYTVFERGYSPYPHLRLVRK